MVIRTMVIWFSCNKDWVDVGLQMCYDVAVNLSAFCLYLDTLPNADIRCGRLILQTKFKGSLILMHWHGYCCGLFLLRPKNKEHRRMVQTIMSLARQEAPGKLRPERTKQGKLVVGMTSKKHSSTTKEGNRKLDRRQQSL